MNHISGIVEQSSAEPLLDSNSGQNSGFLRTIAVLPWYRLEKSIFIPGTSMFGFFLGKTFHKKLALFWPLFLHTLCDNFLYCIPFFLLPLDFPPSSHSAIFFNLIRYVLFLLISPSSFIFWLNYYVLIAPRLMVNMCVK